MLIRNFEMIINFKCLKFHLKIKQFRKFPDFLINFFINLVKSNLIIKFNLTNRI